MVDYVKNTDYAAKDALISGNPAKLIKGTELGAEFDDIATAVATKADLNSPVLVTPNIGTPSAGTLTNCTGLPVSTGVSGLGTGVATFLATPSSANLASAVTDETGSGALVFGTSPTIATPAITGATTITTSSGAALTVTNTGTGNSFVVEDSASPDSTPFIINSSGQVIIGDTTSSDGTAIIQTIGTGSFAPQASFINKANAATSGYIKLMKDRLGATVQASDVLFNLLWSGYDGSAYTASSSIYGAAEGTISTGVVPGRLVFTTYNSAGAATEAMRIDSAQMVTMQKGATVNAASGDALTVTNTGAGNSFVVNDANPDTSPFAINAGGLVAVGHTDFAIAPDASSPSLYQSMAIHGTNSQSALSIYSWVAGTGNAGVLNLVKSYGSAIGTNAAVVSGTAIGAVKFTADDGTSFRQSSSIVGYCDGTVGAGYVPGRLVFNTTNASGTVTEAMRIDSTQAVLAKSATGGLGYGIGAGGTVTQATSRTTGVTINKVTGAITLVSAAGTTSWQSFTVTNSAVAATDTIIVNQKSGTDKNMIHVTAVAAGSFQITFATTGGTTTEQPVFNFAVIKGVTA